jgi:Tol biopolymer transport system component
MSAEPEWSPDGRWIAFWNDRASKEATKADIYVVRPDGTGLGRVTNAPSLWHFNPSWQPLPGVYRRPVTPRPLFVYAQPSARP